MNAIFVSEGPYDAESRSPTVFMQFTGDAIY